MRVALIAPAIAALAILLVAAAGPFYQLGVLALPTAFGLLRSAAYLGLAAAALNVAAVIVAYRHRRRPAAIISAVAALAVLMVVRIPYRWERAAARTPPIHDISTDLQNPPAFKALQSAREGAANDLARPPLVAAQQRRAYPDIQPLLLPEAPELAFEEVVETMQERDWEIVDADMDAGRVEAIDTTPWFGFRDDVVVRVTPSGSGSRIDMRSVSRVGVNDAGTNAARVREFLDGFQRGE